ncbi:hypothetical protein [Chondromyces crocatus]|uniref:Uncharacterized protein n=1 Tax=Chondromyces crocatus TaxID=52 RepID=A0A0K1EQ25_CHOCO|nr:hypothetical protein [Chondromyces crocatus]AKT42951.1 uncharacterized protein CMC5_071790 [Chondromyces crocatus]
MHSTEDTGQEDYVAPRFRASEGATWIHALHGNVPDHQIDFICCPEAPQGGFTRTHLGHLTRLMRYIEPATGSPFAFAIGNLSRDDTQHEPGHGALALLFGLRVAGETDSAGRQDPPLAHAVVAVDRALTGEALLEATLALYHHVTGLTGESTPENFYRAYARGMAQRPRTVPFLLGDYFAGFRDLPVLEPSTLTRHPSQSIEVRSGRIFLLHDADEPFERVAVMAARLAAWLYRSSLRWTAIVFGGTADIPGGLSIEFVTSPPLALGPKDRVLHFSDLADDASARDLLGVRRVPRRPRATSARRSGRSRSSSSHGRAAARPRRLSDPGAAGPVHPALHRRSPALAVAPTPTSWPRAASEPCCRLHGRVTGDAPFGAQRARPAERQRAPRSGWRNVVLSTQREDASPPRRRVVSSGVWLCTGALCALLFLTGLSVIAARTWTLASLGSPSLWLSLGASNESPEAR